MTICSFFFFNDTATTEIYTLSLHDALPISVKKKLKTPAFAAAVSREDVAHGAELAGMAFDDLIRLVIDRKSTRLNSSHANISYAVFCLKKKRPSLVRLR